MDDEAIDREFEILRKEYTWGNLMMDIPVMFLPTVRMIVKAVVHREHDQQALAEILSEELRRESKSKFREDALTRRQMNESELKCWLFRYTHLPRDEELLLRDHPLNGMMVPPSIRCKFCGRQPMQGARFGYTINYWSAVVGICSVCRQAIVTSDEDIRKWGNQLPPTEGTMKLL